MVAAAACALFLFTIGGHWLFTSLFYPGGDTPVTIEVPAGSSVLEIGRIVSDAGLSRSKWAFAGYVALSGATRSLKPGYYLFRSGDRAPHIVRTLVAGPSLEAEVVVIEGASLYDIDALLAVHGVLPEGAFRAQVLASSPLVEGKLFPDTYRFYVSSTPHEVLEKMLANFEGKAAPLLRGRSNAGEENLIMASILEREVREFYDRQVVAGILKKRLKAGMALQVDASICYIKETQGDSGSCYPLSSGDFKADSPYNTYLYKGLPPGPIGNPGLDTIRAALSPVESPYWFYLSDPTTGKTIFSQTLDRHEENRVKYLLQNS